VETCPYIGLTESHSDLWESFGNRSFAANLGGSGFLPFWAAIEPCRRKLFEPAFPSRADAPLSSAAETAGSKLVRGGKLMRLRRSFIEKKQPSAISPRHRDSKSAQASPNHSRICAPNVMTENKRKQAAIPHQDTRNLSCRTWFSSPRGATSITKSHREKKRMRRISHGCARAIESLRGVWLPLVQGPNSGERVLQGL
jgi:hypothetical protein